MTDEQTTDLYRYFNATGNLLYVGISLHAATRAMGHRGNSGWWNEWAGMTVEKHPSRTAALEAERIAIVNERPLHNIKHNSGESLPSVTPIERDGLTGLFFITPDSARGFPRVEWQGRVVSEIAAGNYLVQLYSWLSGDPTNQQLVQIDAMNAWRFYPDHEDWLEAGGKAMRALDRECSKEIRSAAPTN